MITVTSYCKPEHVRSLLSCFGQGILSWSQEKKLGHLLFFHELIPFVLVLGKVQIPGFLNLFLFLKPCYLRVECTINSIL